METELSMCDPCNGGGLIQVGDPVFGQDVECSVCRGTGRVQPVVYEMVYRCYPNVDLLPSCDWVSMEYSEIEKHEDQAGPTHFVMGAMERIENGVPA